MEIKVTKQMIDDCFDFIEGRRKKDGGRVLREVRGAKFPASLLLQENEQSALVDYMNGVNQKTIATRYNLPQRNNVFQIMKFRYAWQIELYWTYTAVTEFLKPVFSLPLEQVLPVGKKTDTTLIACYAEDIMTVGDFITTFTKYEVVVLKYRLKVEKTKDLVFNSIREACYAELKRQEC